jgi:hypothetical protein
MKGGSGEAFYNGSTINLTLAGTSAATGLSIKGKGGDRRITLGDISSDGGMKSFSAKNADLTGTFYAAGDVAKLTFGSVSGTIASAGAMRSLAVAGDVISAKVLSGADLGTDNALGGGGAAADTFGQGAIGAIKISGAVADSTLAAGLDPVNGVFLDSDDRVIGGAASMIGSVSIKGGIDDLSKLVAGAFGKARIPSKANPPTDSHFRIL